MYVMYRLGTSRTCSFVETEFGFLGLTDPPHTHWRKQTERIRFLTPPPSHALWKLPQSPWTSSWPFDYRIDILLITYITVKMPPFCFPRSVSPHTSEDQVRFTQLCLQGPALCILVRDSTSSLNKYENWGEKIQWYPFLLIQIVNLVKIFPYLLSANKKRICIVLFWNM